MGQGTYCKSCGSELATGQKFCTECGASAHVQAGPREAPSRGGDIFENAVGIIIFATFVVALIIIGIVFASGGSGNSGQQASSNMETVTSIQPETVDPNSYTPQATRAEISFYEQLLGYYDALGEYDKRIAEAAESFNANYANADYSTRQSLFNQADSLYYELQSAAAGLSGIAAPSPSVNDSKFAEIQACYSDCINRTAVICDAWNVSLSYQDPAAHKEEILEPIRRDSNGSDNRYYLDFKSRYPNAKPVLP